MNPFDMAIIVLLTYGLIRGIFRGLIKEFSAIIGVLGGFYAAYTYYTHVEVFFTEWLPEPAHRNIVSFMLIFAAVFIIVSILGVIIKYILNIAFLGWADRIGGGGFGIIKGVLIISVLIIPLTSFIPQFTPIMKDSKLSPIISRVSGAMVQVVPRDLKARFQKGLAQGEKAWKGGMGGAAAPKGPEKGKGAKGASE
ncbi:MAG: CvpA family protein [Desulfobacterales bacterium]|nr:CvpA family protein [Desulfobacterales bacterium]